jgi:dihydrodipicolinate synthase/N-acetylneuraminate lyase
MNRSQARRTDLQLSPLAVPPVARNADLSLNEAENGRLIRHIEQGGIRFMMYGGNANFYQARVSEYEELLRMLDRLSSERTWIIPSVGPDFGKIMDQVPILKQLDYSTAMVLPYVGPMTQAGLLDGLRRFSDAFGRPFFLYIKSDNYIEPRHVATLVEEGRILAIKYASVRTDPAYDPYLDSLLEAVAAEYFISGIGERPAITHLRQFGMNSFTTGSGCVAPRGSVEILRAIQAEDWSTAAELREHFIPLEDIRDTTSPIQILHDAVALAEIAQTGPALPFLSNTPAAELPRLRETALALASFNASLQG